VAIITGCCKLEAASEGCGCGGDGDDDGDGGGGGGGGGGGSKVFVHLYSSLLLISSNKISLSVVSDLFPIKNLIFC
jgi:hypothetical protein